MPRLSPAFLAFAAVLAPGFALGAASAGQPPAAGRPVVVELFTSEGCSSCPPAEAYLADLARRPGVLPLAFHVTYWDRLGWRDRYSLEAATVRQAAYGARFGDGSYTPEMVVDGMRALVGSDRAAGDAAIATAAAAERAAAGGPAVAVARGAGSAGGLAIRVGAGTGAGRLLLVGFDREHRTAIGRGENTGRTVTEVDAVRSLGDLGAWTGAPVAIDAPAPAGEEAAVLLQAPDGRILGAARTGG